jgi:hypothetical protein
MKKGKKGSDLPPIKTDYHNVNKLEETENILHEKDKYIKTLIQKLAENDLEIKEKEQEVVSLYITTLDKNFIRPA